MPNGCDRISLHCYCHCAVSRNRCKLPVGVAEYHTALHNLAYRFIECADQAMYQAKRSGKNRVCQHKPSQQQLTATELDLLRHHAPGLN